MIAKVSYPLPCSPSLQTFFLAATLFASITTAQEYDLFSGGYLQEDYEDPNGPFIQTEEFDSSDSEPQAGWSFLSGPMKQV